MSIHINIVYNNHHFSREIKKKSPVFRAAELKKKNLKWTEFGVHQHCKIESNSTSFVSQRLVKERLTNREGSTIVSRGLE